MKNLWNSYVLFALLFVVLSNSYGQFTIDTDKLGSNEFIESDKTNETKNSSNLGEVKPKDSKKVDDGYHFGVWVNYQQQIGALGDKVLTIGGPSFGFNLGRYFFIGGGIYSSFGNIELDGKDRSLLYGGGIAGFRWNPNSPVVFRTQVLLGAAGFDTISSKSPNTITSRDISVIVVPEVALDIRLVGGLYLTIAANYRYVEDLPDEWSEMKGLGALSGIVSLGLSF